MAATTAVATTAFGDIEDMGLWYRDTTLTLLERRTNTYAQVKVPDTIDEMFDHMAANRRRPGEKPDDDS